MALGIFEQTFQATNALSLIGLAVAFAGLLLGLFSIFDESTQTWMTLKHLGFSTPKFILAAGLEGAGDRGSRMGSRCDHWTGTWLVIGLCDQCPVLWLDLIVDGAT